jgi:predicted transcriptional regulator
MVKMNPISAKPPGELEDNPSATTDELLEFFKALADGNRLRILGVLAREPLTVEQLAEMLGLRPSTVSHHLQYLAHVRLVSARAEGYYNIYRLEEARLEGMAHQLLAKETLPGVAADVDMDAYDRKVIANFTTPDGRVKAFPAQRKKFEAILRYVLRVFEPGVRYSEKQVNQMLGHFHEDTATLRRELVGYGWLKREGGGGDYWRPEGKP